MASMSPSLLRASAPLARAAVSIAQRPGVRAIAGAAARDAAGGSRGALMPAAVRVERARSRRHGEVAEQTAVTLWFGEGPSLPSPGTSAVRSAARFGAGVVGAVALAALTALAARREESRGTVLDAPAQPRQH
jgi:hypothetical protein